MGDKCPCTVRNRTVRPFDAENLACGEARHDFDPVEKRKILIVEDHRQSGEWLTSILAEAGYTVIGPVDSAEAALAKIAEHAVDAALLDVGLGGDQRVYPVADVLAALHIPFVFMSGLSPNLLPPKYRDRPYLAKPYGHADVLAALGRAVPAEAGPSEPAPPS